MKGDTMLEKKVEKFNKFERIFMNIHLGILGVGVFLLTVAFIVVDSIESIARVFLGVVFGLFYIIIFNFIIALFRLFKYLFLFQKEEEVLPTIKRTIIIILTSPISLAIYFILTLIMSLSLATCST